MRAAAIGSIEGGARERDSDAGHAGGPLFPARPRGPVWADNARLRWECASHWGGEQGIFCLKQKSSRSSLRLVRSGRAPPAGGATRATRATRDDGGGDTQHWA